MKSVKYAVIDVETTGFGMDDRILEIAVVHLEDDGTQSSTWSTLVNAQRRIAYTRIHGISTEDLLGAPSFSGIAHELAALLDGRVLVAHNADFDIRMLGQEYRRLELDIDLASLKDTSVCTMRLTGVVHPGTGRSLDAALNREGIENQRPHTALGDAEATALLLGSYISHGHLEALNYRTC